MAKPKKEKKETQLSKESRSLAVVPSIAASLFSTNDSKDAEIDETKIEPHLMLAILRVICNLRILTRINKNKLVWQNQKRKRKKHS